MPRQYRARCMGSYIVCCIARLRRLAEAVEGTFPFNARAFTPVPDFPFCGFSPGDDAGFVLQAACGEANPNCR